MNKTSTGLVEFARRHLGHPYWYGTFGNVANEDLLQRKRKQYPAHYQNNRMPRYRSDFGRRVFDCVGLVKGYLWEKNGVISYVQPQDLSANMMLSRAMRSGGISSMPDVPGTLVFFPGHVGVYVGGGQVIEAQGFASGVIQTALRSRPWRNWAECPFIKYTTPAPLSVNQLSLEVNGRDMPDVKMKNVAGRTFVYLKGENNQWSWIESKELAATLGASIDWDGPTQTVKLRVLP